MNFLVYSYFLVFHKQQVGFLKSRRCATSYQKECWNMRVAICNQNTASHRKNLANVEKCIHDYY